VPKGQNFLNFVPFANTKIQIQSVQWIFKSPNNTIQPLFHENSQFSRQFSRESATPA